MLVGVLAVVVIVVAVLVLTYPDGSNIEPGPAGNADHGVTPADAGAQADDGTAGSVGGVVSGPAQVDQVNTFCQSYVYKRCNELVIGPSDCRGIVDAGADVPQNLGLAGCRSVVDEILARVAGIPEENILAAPAVGGVVVDVVEPDAETAVGPGNEPAQESEDEAGTGQSGPAGVESPAVAGPDPASVAAAMDIAVGKVSLDDCDMLT